MVARFDLLTPASLPEALEMLSGRLDVLPIAGGTNVVVGMRDGMYSACAFVDVSRLEELKGIRHENDHVVIGAGTTLAELLESPVIAENARPLCQAAQVFANPLVRNRATVAGNLVDASPAADTAPPLLVLDAELELASVTGARWVPLDEFFLGPNHTVRRPDELVLAIRWPIPTEGSVGGFQKLALRRGTACSVISVAATLSCDRDGSCSKARIALGAVAAQPLRAKTAEAGLLGRPLTAEAIEKAGVQAGSAAQPIDDVRGTAAYRKRMAVVLVRRLLAALVEEMWA